MWEEMGGWGGTGPAACPHLLSSAQSVSASPESPPDEEMGLKRSQEEKEPPGRYVSVGLLGGGQESCKEMS